MSESKKLKDILVQIDYPLEHIPMEWGGLGAPPSCTYARVNKDITYDLGDRIRGVRALLKRKGHVTKSDLSYVLVAVDFELHRLNYVLDELGEMEVTQ